MNLCLTILHECSSMYNVYIPTTDIDFSLPCNPQTGDNMSVILSSHIFSALLATACLTVSVSGIVVNFVQPLYPLYTCTANYCLLDLHLGAV